MPLESDSKTEVAAIDSVAKSRLFPAFILPSIAKG